MLGSIANIYQSIERLDDTYLQTTQNKTLLLNPKVSLPSHSQPMLFLPGPLAPKRYYICPLCYSNYNNVVHFTDVYGTHCPCNGQMTKEMHYMDSKSNRVEVNGGGGFVHGIVTYTISDDLTVTAMSTISSITLLNNFNIKDLGSLEESTVELGLEEVIFSLAVYLLISHAIT